MREETEPESKESKTETGRRVDDRQVEIRAGHWLEEAGDGDFRWVTPCLASTG